MKGTAGAEIGVEQLAAGILQDDVEVGGAGDLAGAHDVVPRRVGHIDEVLEAAVRHLGVDDLAARSFGTPSHTNQICAFNPKLSQCLPSRHYQADGAIVNREASTLGCERWPATASRSR